MEYSGKLPTENVNVSDKSPLKEFATLLFGLFAIIFIIYSLLGLAVDYAVLRLSPEQEKSLSFSLEKELMFEEGDDRQSRVLQKMVDEMLSRCVELTYQVKVFVAREDSINAVALPGGTIMVFSGLLKKVRSENELAFILGHELGHFNNKDHLRGMGRGLVLLMLVNALLGSNSGAEDFVSYFLTFSESRFSRQQESVADSFALEAVQCRYGHVSGSTDFFETLVKEEEPGRFGHFLSSHPDSRERIKDLKTLVKQSGFGTGKLTRLGLVINNRPDPTPEK